ncbi:ATP-binding protein [Frigidibacter sp. ROC022]|uniref:ATP-binding protein n=1 Tax=Frigidibacter sp. ROC022 TaxID=2971796 RepID=UPI00215A1494|nr:ATP-binding protein [Frigidibacter sp. ROC022]MCR8724718.1 ATP-binding protein [Frigidibacter sp. ROC022]
MDQAQSLAQERRARLAAERQLAQTRDELSVANRELSRHARSLSFEIIEKREEVAEVRSEKSRVLVDLQAAETKVSVAQRRLWTSLTTIQDGFALFGADDVLIAANPAWLKPFDGVAAVAPGARYSDILTIALDEGMIDIGGDDPAAWRARMLARWHGDRIEPVTIRLWNGIYIRLVDRQGEGGDKVSLALDITRHIRFEARLRDARRRAEAASRAKSAFLANMSHELRTPMNGVVGMADLLAETPLNEEQRGFVETIRNSGEALLVIINDILDLSKIDARKMALHPAPFDLEQAVQEVVQLMQPMVQGRPVQLQIDYDLFLPTRFRGDVGRVRQILTNLVGNAVKFTEQGQITVRVTGAPDGADGWQVHVAVEDTGIGIAPEMLRHVFGEFNQVENARDRRYEGTGLGLAISERLVRLMGGEIWANSSPGKGSCFGFRVRLPEAGPEGGVLPAPRHILLIDPDDDSANLLRSQLMALRMQVSLRADAGSALADMPDDVGLVLAAARLPDMTVEALAQRLIGAGLSVPFLAVTDSRSGALPGSGLMGRLERPISRGSLIAALAPLPLPVVPGADDHATSDTEKPLSDTDLAPRPPTGRQMRVLAAEDNRTNRLVLDKMLGKLDIDLRFAGNGEEAVALHAGFRPDLIFMDISMPLMDGKEATRRIRAAESESGAHVPIVALTAHALNGDDRQILAAGLDHYLTKPLKKAAILERLLAACPGECRPVLRDQAAPPPPAAAAE